MQICQRLGDYLAIFKFFNMNLFIIKWFKPKQMVKQAQISTVFVLYNVAGIIYASLGVYSNLSM